MNRQEEFKKAIYSEGKGKKALLIVLAVAVIGLLSLGWYFLGSSKEKGYGLRFQTEPVGRGDITVKVSATGTLQALNQVDVGVEISGTIEKVEVDFNSIVKKGQVLARLDTSKLEAQVLQSKAQLELARAKVKEAEAELLLARTKLSQLKEAQRLSGGKVPSQAEMDMALANVAKAEAAVMQARAQVSNAEADLRFNQTNLSKAVIRSPLDGIVLARKIEAGQTVAASLQTPVLFTIAEDLSKMELSVDVDEADIGKVKVGQKAEFSVDAYPGRRFTAQVKEVRLSPKTVQGVVTYESILGVENPELLLKPGMTAVAEIVVMELKSVLLIPNRALRFTPPATTKHGEQDQKRGLLGAMFPFRPPTGSEPKELPKKGQTERVVYKLEGERLLPVHVLLGETDGRFTQIKAGELKEGDLVVVGMVQKTDERK